MVTSETRVLRKRKNCRSLDFARDDKVESDASIESCLDGWGEQPQGLGRVCEYREKNRRSIHYAPPDFPSGSVVLINIVRFS
jgi:hypothetical protein